MAKYKNRKILVFAIFSLLIVSLSLFLRHFFENISESKGDIVIIPNFFKISVIKNEGISFSLFQNNRVVVIIIPIILIMVILLAFFKFLKSFNMFNVICFSFIFGGALSNLIFRITYGYVIDYFSFFNFPIFNFPDAILFIGIVLFLITILFFKKTKHR